jgi:predicted enzyme related to lactoylglutathione lyase
MRGRFVWHELMTSDPKKAADFYRTVIRWTMEDMDVGMTYTVFSSKKGQLGGIMGKPAGLPANVPSHWTPYVYVPDLEAASEQAKSLGGSVIMGPQEVPNMGRFSFITDPQGAVLALWQANAEMNPNDITAQETEPRQGDFSWHELMTTDYQAALQFYSAMFGWTAGRGQDMGAMGIYQIYERDGVQLGGMFNRMPEIEAPPSWTLYINVTDVKKTAEAVKANGGQVIHGPVEVPGGSMIANCTDPTGAIFAVHQVKA